MSKHISIPKHEVERVINVLRYGAHPHPSPHADFLARLFEEPTPAQDVRETVTYVECRECTDCGHAGINDQVDGDSACSNCGWHGSSPEEDKCPECQREGTMSASCPECGCKYRLIADAEIATRPAETERLRAQILEQDAAIEEWSGTAVQNGMECDKLTTRVAELVEALRRLTDAVTPGVIDWVRCGLSANGRLVDGDHPALSELVAARRAALADQGGTL